MAIAPNLFFASAVEGEAIRAKLVMSISESDSIRCFIFNPFEYKNNF